MSYSSEDECYYEDNPDVDTDHDDNYIQGEDTNGSSYNSEDEDTIAESQWGCHNEELYPDGLFDYDHEVADAADIEYTCELFGKEECHMQEAADYSEEVAVEDSSSSSDEDEFEYFSLHLDDSMIDHSAACGTYQHTQYQHQWQQSPIIHPHGSPVPLSPPMTFPRHVQKASWQLQSSHPIQLVLLQY